jgi:hypothetical protein
MSKEGPAVEVRLVTPAVRYPSLERASPSIVGSLEFLAGAVASGVSAAAVYPVDLVKTRMQNERRARLADGAVARPRTGLQLFAAMVRSEGPLALYSGLLPQLLGQVPEKALRLFLVERVRALFRDDDDAPVGRPSLVAELTAGLVAGANQVLITNPAEIVKVRLQLQGGEADGARQTTAGVLRELGLRGMYRGASACFLRDVPFSGIYFPAFAALKEMFRGPGGGSLSAVELFASATVAGAVAAGLTTPADVIKTRMQARTRAGEAPYRGLLHCAGTIVRDEGPSTLFRGLVPRVVRSAPQYGVMLFVYEHLMRFVGHARDEVLPALVDRRDSATVLVAEDKLGMVLDESWRAPVEFMRFHSPLRQLSVGGSTSVWGLSDRNEIFRWSGMYWDRVPGRLAQISAGGDGAVWGLDERGAAFRYNAFHADLWEPVPGAPMAHVTVGSAGEVWGILADAARGAVRWDGAAWRGMGASALQNISAAADGEVWAVREAPGGARLCRFSRRRDSWVDVSFPSEPKWVSVGGRGHVWVSDASGFRFRLLASSQAWVRVGDQPSNSRAAVGVDAVAINS